MPPAAAHRRPKPYLASTRHPDGTVVTYNAHGNSIKTAYTYHAQTRRLSNLTAGKGNGNLFQNLIYSYDKVGNILGLQNDVPVPPPSQYGGPTNQSFVYDQLYRLTHAQGTYQYSPSKTHTYNLDLGYDSIHNITTKNQLHTIVQPSQQAITQKKTSYNWAYAYNPSGATSVRPHAPIHIGERAFTYDANGNQLGWTHDQNGTNRTIVWDEDNRIQALADQGHVKYYKYDDQGQRIIKRGPQGETVYVNQFYTQRPGATGTKHIYAGTTRLVSKLVKQDTPNGNPQGATPYEKDLYFYHPDHLGTSNYITDTQGKLYEHLEYFPFGEGWVEENSNTQRTPYLFTAKELDEETGLYYYGARYFDPRTSVFQSGDPILNQYLDGRPNSGVFNPKNLGLYSYVVNNPFGATDPTGRECNSAEGTTTCDVPGTNITVPFPTPGDWPEELSSKSSRFYHKYDKDVSAGPRSAPIADKIRDALAKDPTPGNDKPATKEGTPNDATPPGGFLGWYGEKTGGSPVKTYLREANGKKITVNVTQPGHPLHPGYVVRIVEETKGGESIVRNIGEGAAIKQSNYSPFSDMINNVWIKQTNDVIERVRKEDQR
jgi:RHS repeat-associated protein